MPGKNLRRNKKDLEEKVANLDNARARDDERYRALLRDYDAVADKKAETMKRVNLLEGEVVEKEKIMLNLKSDNADLKSEIARYYAPKYKQHRSQSADATTPPRKAASSAGSAASSRSSSATSGSQWGKRSANMLKI